MEQTFKLLEQAFHAAKLAQSPSEQVSAIIAQAAILLIIPKGEEKAVNILEEAMAESRKLSNNTLLQLSIYTLGLSEFFTGKYSEADKHFRELMGMVNASENESLYTESKYLYAWNLVSAERLDDAGKSINETINAPANTQNKLLLTRFYRLLGSINYRQGKNKEGLEETEKALEIARQADNDKQVSLAAVIISSVSQLLQTRC